MPNKELVFKSFEQCAETFNKSDFLYNEFADRLINRLKFCKIRPERILILGSRTGYLTNILNDIYQDCEIVNFEISKNMLSKGYAPNSVCGDYCSLPFKNAIFDIVVSNISLEWGNNIQDLLSECQRVLSNEGLLIASASIKQDFSLTADVLLGPRELDIESIQSSLIQDNWYATVLERELLSVEYSSQGKLLNDLRNMGYQFSESSVDSRVMNKPTILNLETLYIHAINKVSKNFKYI